MSSDFCESCGKEFACGKSRFCAKCRRYIDLDDPALKTWRNLDVELMGAIKRTTQSRLELSGEPGITIGFTITFKDWKIIVDNLMKAREQEGDGTHPDQMGPWI